MYCLEKKNGNLDYTKRQILLVQESYKVLAPALFVLAAALLALNIANAVHNFMAVYLCVAVNAVGVGACVWILMQLVRGNGRQRHLFEQLREQTAVTGACEQGLCYETDTEGVLRGAQAVLVAENEQAYIVVPALPPYKHGLFTRYDFRGDFGRLTLPKQAFVRQEEDGKVQFVSGDVRFVFAFSAKKKEATKRDDHA